MSVTFGINFICYFCSASLCLPLSLSLSFSPCLSLSLAVSVSLSVSRALSFFFLPLTLGVTIATFGKYQKKQQKIIFVFLNQKKCCWLFVSPFTLSPSKYLKQNCLLRVREILIFCIYKNCYQSY
jgi:hypothetical protein